MSFRVGEYPDLIALYVFELEKETTFTGSEANVPLLNQKLQIITFEIII